MVYKRVLLKISGEVLAGGGFGFDHSIIASITEQIKRVALSGVAVAIVIGGGNIWRGRVGATMNMDATTADHMGMLATVINSLALQESLERSGVQTRVQTAVEMRQFAEPYIRRRAVRHLEKGRVVIFGCGTGNPFFSTDTGATLRAAEIEADIVLRATNTDGVYDADPKLNEDARFLSDITYRDYIAQNLRAMDNTAVTLSMNSGIPIRIFNLLPVENIYRAAMGEDIGTLLHA